MSQKIHSFVAKKADFLFTPVEDASTEPASSSVDGDYLMLILEEPICLQEFREYNLLVKFW